jgi:hypothetical protein
MRRLLTILTLAFIPSGLCAQQSPVVRGGSFDLTQIRCPNAVGPIRISVPDSFKVNGCGDTISVIHPNAIYFPERFGGFRLWCVFSVMSGLNCDENTFLRVSNDGQNWIRFPGCPDPLSWRSDFVDSSQGTPPNFVGSTYASDPDLFRGFDGRLWVITRAFFESGGKKAALYIRWSSDGVSWSANRRISPFVTGDASLLSPAVFLDSAGTYRMWSVCYNNESDGRVRGRIEVRKASTPDGVWTLVDTVKQSGTSRLFPAGKDTTTISDDTIWTAQYTPWHLGLVDNGTGEKIVLLTARNNGVIDKTHPAYVDFIGITHDGRSLELRNEPLLRPSFANGSPDSQYVYKATGWVENRGGYGSIKVLYSGKGTNYWHTSLTGFDYIQEPDSSQFDTTSVLVRRTR